MPSNSRKRTAFATSIMSDPEFIPYPELVEARKRIWRFVRRLERARLATGNAADMQSYAIPGGLCIHGPSGNGKTHVLSTLAATYCHRLRSIDDHCEPVWLIRADDLITQTAQLRGDWAHVADRCAEGSALLVDDVECLREDAAARACLARIARGFVLRKRLVVFAETSAPVAARKTTILETAEFAWLRRMTESVEIVSPGELGIKMLIRHFARQQEQRFPLPLVEEMAASVLRLNQPSIRSCQQITTKLAAWCVFHRVEPSVDSLEAMRADALRNVGLNLGLVK